MKKILTQARLKELLDYDQITGIFKRKISRGGMNVGAVAGSCDKDGYIKVSVDNRRYKAHRLAWLFMDGYFPESDIDHINRIRNDNRWSNLRLVSDQCNTRNSGLRRNNKSGVTGVFWSRDYRYWVSQITVNRKNIFLGSFKDFESAVKARWEAENKYEFPNCCTTSSAYEYLTKHGLLEAAE